MTCDACGWHPGQKRLHPKECDYWLRHRECGYCLAAATDGVELLHEVECPYRRRGESGRTS